MSGGIGNGHGMGAFEDDVSDLSMLSPAFPSVVHALPNVCPHVRCGVKQRLHDRSFLFT